MNLEQIQSIVNKHVHMSHYKGYTHTAKLVNSKRYLGRCVVYFAKKLVVIEISRFHAKNANPEEVMDTVLHEIAHMIASVQAEHNEVWKAACLKIGASPEAVAKCSDIADLGIEPKYVLVHKRDLRIVSVAHSARKKWVKRPQDFSVNNEPVGNLACIDYTFYSKYITSKPYMINALIGTMEEVQKKTAWLLDIQHPINYTFLEMMKRRKHYDFQTTSRRTGFTDYQRI